MIFPFPNMVPKLQSFSRSQAREKKISELGEFAVLKTKICKKFLFIALLTITLSTLSAFPADAEVLSLTVGIDSTCPYGLIA
jgi:hypothetical protein